MSAAGNDNQLRINLLGKHWPDGRQVLGPIQFSMRASEVIAISGPSGCGKSTLLSILAGLDHDFEGRLEWSGEPRLGVVFQTPRLLPWRTAIENVALGLAGEKNTLLQARLALAEVGLAEAADAYPSRLSLGMARRVAFARALLAEPEVLLLDEAFASLDEDVAGKLRTSVLARVAARSMSVLMVTHDLRDSTEMAGRLITLGGTPTRVITARSTPTPPPGNTGARYVMPMAAPPGPSSGRGSSPP